MNFLHEQAWLWLPLALAGALIAWLAYSKQRQMIGSWGSFENASRYGVGVPRRRYIIKGVLATLALAAGFAALARPTIESKHVSFQAGTVDVVVLLDVSRSMAARDCQGATRMSRARTILREEISPSLDHNQLGVIAYAGKATPVVFLTGELETVNWLAENELKISSAPGQGSAMGQAFDLAFKFFDHDSDKTRRKMIVLLSDGGTDDDTKLEDIVKGCRDRNVTVIVVGLGMTQPALIPVEELGEEDRRLSMDQFYKIDGKTAMTSLDVVTLSQLTRAVGDNATFVQATGPEDFTFKPLTSHLSPKEKVGVKELYFYPCLAFFLLICVTPVLTAKRARLEKKPQTSVEKPKTVN
jgi:Mg-chelatase subunit ChlD